MWGENMKIIITRLHLLQSLTIDILNKQGTLQVPFVF